MINKFILALGGLFVCAMPGIAADDADMGASDGDKE